MREQDTTTEWQKGILDPFPKLSFHPFRPLSAYLLPSHGTMGPFRDQDLVFFRRLASNGRQWLPSLWPLVGNRALKKRHQSALVGNFCQHILIQGLPARRLASPALLVVSVARGAPSTYYFRDNNNREKVLRWATSKLGTPLFPFPRRTSSTAPNVLDG